MEALEKLTVKWKSEGKVNQKIIEFSTGECSEEAFEDIWRHKAFSYSRRLLGKKGFQKTPLDEQRKAEMLNAKQKKKKDTLTNQSDM